MAKKYSIELEVLSSIVVAPGTKVKETVKMEKMLVKGVAKDLDIARINIVGLPDEPGIAFRVFSRVAKAHVNVDLIIQSVGRDGTKDITFTVKKSDAQKTVDALQEYCDHLKAKKLFFETNIAKISVVGAGLETHEGFAARMFEALSDKNINIQAISTSEIKVSVLIDQADADVAVSSVHNALFGE